MRTASQPSATATKVYRFRAETEYLGRSVAWIMPESERVRFEMLRSARLGVVCEIEVRSLSLVEMRQLCRQIRDGAMAVETMQPKDQWQ